MKQYRVAFDPEYGIEIVEEPDYFGPVTRYYEYDVYHVIANSEEEAIEKAQESDEITEIDCGELENIEALAIDACTDKE